MRLASSAPAIASGELGPLWRRCRRIARRRLEAEFGIDSAESFFAYALDNPAGMARALDVGPAEVDRLIGLVEGYLPAGYRARCLEPARRPRGLIGDPGRAEAASGVVIDRRRTFGIP